MWNLIKFQVFRSVEVFLFWLFLIISLFYPVFFILAMVFYLAAKQEDTYQRIIAIIREEKNNEHQS